MRNLTNYHSHSLYCDGHAPIKAFLDEAVKLGFTSYGVSPHAPLPWVTRWSMMMLELPVYLYEMKMLKSQYKDKLELYCGFEIDYIDSDINPLAEIFNNNDAIDYKIGSVHLIKNQSGLLTDIDLNTEKFRKVLVNVFDNDIEYVISKYFETELEMLNTGGFDIVGHLDKISHNVESCKKGITSSKMYLDYISRIIELAIQKDYIIEVNTKAFNKQGITFIGQEHYPLLAEAKAKVIVNSDSHYPELINAGRMETLANLKSAGITSVMELHNGKWLNVAIG